MTGNNDMLPFYTVRGFVEKFPFFTYGGLRHLLFSDAEFRSRCVRQVGRKILLSTQDVMDFLGEQRGDNNG